MIDKFLKQAKVFHECEVQEALKWMYLEYNKGAKGENRWEIEKENILECFKRRDENPKFGGFFICDRCGRAKSYRFESRKHHICKECVNA